MTNSPTHTPNSDSRYSSFSQIFDLLEKGSHITLEGDLDDTITDPNNGNQYSFEQWMLSAFLYEKEPGGDIETRRGIELVLLYDAAMKRLSLGDQRLFGLKDSVSQMRSALLKNTPDILIHGRKPPGDMPPPVELLMTPGAIITNEQNQADRVLLELIRHLDKQKIKTALIIQHPEHMVSTQSGVIDPQSSVAQSIISDFTREATHVQCVFLDPRKSFVKQVPEVATYSAHIVISGNTKNDILSLISARSDVPGELQEKIASLGVGMKTRSVLDIFSRYGSGEEVLKHLIKARTKGIIDGSGKLLEAEIVPFTEGTISLTGQAKIFWNTIAANFLKRPDIIPSNILLLGPPGTGKSIAPKYLASLMGVPYIKLSNLGTEGLRGVALDKAMRVFEIIVRNKPCVLHIDEIDKILPKHQPGWQSNNDEEVMAYIQDKLADTDFMKGIMVVGTSNEPLSLGDAMLRSGRFGVRVAMMPPTTLSEKIDVFRAVWNQIASLGDIKMPDERFIASLLSTTPSHATGADFRDRIEESARLLFSSENPDFLHEHLVTTFCRDFTKGDQYDRTHEASLSLHNAWVLHDGKEDSPELTAEQAYIQSVALILDSIHTSTAERAGALESCQKINTDIDTAITTSLADLQHLTEALTMLPETVREQMQSFMSEERRLLDAIHEERKALEAKKGELNESIRRHEAILLQSRDALTRIQHERTQIEKARRDQLIITAVTGREPQPISK